ncbi:MAG TPA: hypothetical protein VLE49_19325 [Anaerolineales bacterium]|nr:hypothetical protein [Anaerolineales bacterium]
MDLGAIIEVAVGLIFVWIVLSMTTIQIQEWITTRLDKRARDMEDAIHEMLANPNLKAQFYDHPIIRGLTAKKRKEPSRIPAWFYKYPILRGFTKEKRKLPSYIPSQQFALSLFDIALTAGTESSLIQQGILKIRDDLQNDRKLTVNEAVIEELNLLAEFARSAAATEAGTAITKRTLESLRNEAEQFMENFHKKHPKIRLTPDIKRELREGLEQALTEAERLKGQIDEVLEKQPKVKATDSALSKVRRGIAALSVISPEVNQTLSALLLNVEEYATEGEKHLALARQNVENWFDDSMDRVSGTFKRYAQMMALIIGFLVALLLNVDSINLTIYLWREPSVRQALAQNAANFELPQAQLEANPEQAMQDFRKQFVGLNLPIGWVIDESQGSAFSDKDCQLFPGIDQTFGIPVFASNKCLAPSQSNNQSNIALKFIGIFLTALAARQGAPFWFDILKRFVNLRSTGANPDEKTGK